MHIRRYRPEDLSRIVTLFQETVWTVGGQYYALQELEAWAPADIEAATWKPRLARNTALVAEESGLVVGFAELSPQGVIDMLFVDKDRQGLGIATLLFSELEAKARKDGLTRLLTHASRVARPFFLSRGFKVLAEQQVERGGLHIENFRMAKKLAPP